MRTFKYRKEEVIEVKEFGDWSTQVGKIIADRQLPASGNYFPLWNKGKKRLFSLAYQNLSFHVIAGKGKMKSTPFHNRTRRTARSSR